MCLVTLVDGIGSPCQMCPVRRLDDERVHVGLDRLVDAELARYVPESRAFYAARGERRGPAFLEELPEARGAQGAAPLPPGAAVERVVDACGRTLPLRIFLPETLPARGAYLDIPGGGFYLGPTAG